MMRDNSLLLLFIELRQTGSLCLHVLGIYSCTYKGGFNFACLIGYRLIAMEVFGKNSGK